MKLRNYLSECSSELKKVIWPTKSQVASYIRVVLVSTIISALILGVIDFLAVRGISYLF